MPGKKLVHLALALLCLALLAGPALAQVRPGALIVKTITRPGDPLPKVTLELEGEDKTRTRQTNHKGEVRFDPLPAGVYEVKASRQGLKTVEGAKVVVTPGGFARLTMVMSPAEP